MGLLPQPFTMDFPTDTPLEDIPEIHKTLKDTFRAGKLRSISFRRTQLAQLAYLLQDNYVAFQEALFDDFGKHPIEANMGELVTLFQRTLDAISNLDQWTANVDLSSETSPMYAALNPVLIKQPRGPVLIIGYVCEHKIDELQTLFMNTWFSSPFNAPLLLNLQPLIGAIAAGCPAVIKPSDLSTQCSSLIFKLVHKYLDNDCYRVVLGGVDQATRLLDLKWGSGIYFFCLRPISLLIETSLCSLLYGWYKSWRYCCRCRRQTHDTCDTWG